ncbi:MAG: phytanoyl-CoA dioxygenase family protein [Actinobacteria bacterium]|nr:phytanoyl-CoA dioxygenase family protein [Actinomycetota bacterium]
MLQLQDSSSLIGDRDALLGRLSVDGYLYFRAALPPAMMRAAGQTIDRQLRAGGWSAGPGGPQAATFREALADPAFRKATISPAFNHIPYLPPLRRLIRGLLGPQAFSYPAKVLRAVHPEAPAGLGGLDGFRWRGRRAGARPGRPRGRYVHYDYAVGGVQDMLTTWVPLMDIPVQLGGLAVQPGGHLAGPRPPRVLGLREPGWASTGYHPGDVIVFHCLTPHAALPNHGAELRLSADFRWQRADQPAPRELVTGPAGRPAEVFGRLFRDEPWWEPVPDQLTLCPRAELAAVPPGPSRFFPVHPGWQRWHLPADAVH